MQILNIVHLVWNQRHQQMHQLFLSSQFARLLLMHLWSWAWIWCWIEMRGSGDQLLQQLHRHLQDAAGIQEWEGEKSKRERDASYKAKSGLFGRNLWAVRPGFGSETGLRWANECPHNSPQWCTGVEGHKLLKFYSPGRVVWACVWQQRRHVDDRLRLRAPASSLNESIRLQS